MPSTSVAQQRFMGADLARKREGKKTQTGMSEKQLKDFASTKHKGLPGKVGKGQASLDPDKRRPGVDFPVPPSNEEINTYGPYDPPGYYRGRQEMGPHQPMQPPVPQIPPPGGQEPTQSMDPIDQQIQQLLLQKQMQIQQGQQAMQGQMPQRPPMGGAPGMGQGVPDPRMAPPPIGTGLQTMPLGGKPLQDPAISGAMSPGIASRALGGPPPVGPPPAPAPSVPSPAPTS